MTEKNQPEPASFTRRRFATVVTTALLGVGLLPASYLWLTQRDQQQEPLTTFPLLEDRFHTFTPYQATVLQEVSAWIIPTDQDPGAREARVVYELDRMVTDQQGMKNLFTQGVQWLDSKTQELFETQSFLNLQPDAQHHILLLADSGEISFVEKLMQRAQFGESQLGQRFFKKMTRQTLIAFYSNPLGWQVVGYQGPPQWTGHLDYNFCG